MVLGVGHFVQYQGNLVSGKVTFKACPPPFQLRFRPTCSGLCGFCLLGNCAF